jgi:hypothetical protein
MNELETCVKRIESMRVTNHQSDLALVRRNREAGHTDSKLSLPENNVALHMGLREEAEYNDGSDSNRPICEFL